MCFRNCWYAAIFESHANNPKLKTGETVSRFELNSSVKQPFRGESLLENQKINQAGLILHQKIEISELQSRINLLFNRLCKVKSRLTRKPDSKWHYQICTCSVILGKLESFRNYKGLTSILLKILDANSIVLRKREFF